MKILGYSERGIINSLIFSIGECPKLMKKFIELIDLPKTFKLGDPENYTILLEQSFSGFGDSDLIIIIEYASHKKVVFIEGKVKTSQRKSWSLEKQFEKFDKGGNYPGYSSNLFYQLYLKSLLFENKGIIKWEKDMKTDEDKVANFKDVIANCGFRNRKIGGNKIVWKAMKKIEECDEAYYVGLLPSQKKDNDEFNEKLDYNIHFLSWEDVEAFCIENELEKVIDIFKYNIGQIYEPKS